MRLLAIALLTCLISVSCQQDKNNDNVPVTKKVASSTTYFGEKVQDNYAWLENIEDRPVKEWIKEQNKHSDQFLKGFSYREDIKNEIRELRRYNLYEMPQRYGDYLYYFVSTVEHRKQILYRENVKTKKVESYLDPNTIFKDENLYIRKSSFSPDGKYLAIVASPGGSDWGNMLIFDLLNKKFLPDTIKNVKFSRISWYKNSFFYTGYGLEAEDDRFSEVSSRYQNVYRHT